MKKKLVLFRLVYADGSVEFVECNGEDDLWDNFVDDDNRPVLVEEVRRGILAV